MIGRYINGSSKRTQWDVVAHIKGDYHPNFSCAKFEFNMGIKYAACNKHTYKYGATKSFDYHKSSIVNGFPLGVWVKWDSGGAHVMVCSGTKTSGGVNYLYIIDPWENTANKWYSYNALKNGTKIQTGKGKYCTSYWKK